MSVHSDLVAHRRRAVPAASPSATAAVAALIFCAVAVRGDGMEVCPGTSQTVSVGSRTVAVCRAGEGLPLVILESGLGDGLESWADLIGDIGTFTAVLAYDRAGLGGSSPVEGPRDAQSVSRELEELLHTLSFTGPVILVGHSIGGIFVRRFAADHPDQVAGLVLVDPRPDGFGELQHEIMGESRFAAFRERVLARLEGTPRLEHDAMTESERQVAGSARPVPTGVLLSAGRIEGRDPEIAPKVKEVWLERQRLLAGELGIEQQIAPTGHYVHRERPDLVVDAIRRATEAFRSTERATVAGRADAPR